MSALIPFAYSGHSVRALTRDGEPWFVGRDVCAVLDIADARASLNLLDEDERDSVPVADSLGREQSTIVINEPGLYSLILRSRKPEAKAFKRWVTHEVLPTIRRAGQFAVPLSRLELAENWADAERRLEAKDRALAAAQPKVDAYDRFLTADGDYTVATAAQMLGMGQNGLFARLRDQHILISGGRRHNTPYQQYAHHFRVVGRTHDDGEREHVSFTTYVRPSGVDFLRKFLAVTAAP